MSQTCDRRTVIHYDKNKIGYLNSLMASTSCRGEGLVSSSNSESNTGGGFTTSSVSQAGQVKRVGTRRREIPRRRELRQKIPLMPEAASSVTT